MCACVSEKEKVKSQTSCPSCTYTSRKGIDLTTQPPSTLLKWELLHKLPGRIPNQKIHMSRGNSTAKPHKALLRFSLYSYGMFGLLFKL